MPQSKKKRSRQLRNTPISLHPLDVEQALKKIMDAGPMPEKRIEDTKPSGHRRSAKGHESDQRQSPSGD